jgi:hypothetical protein
LSHEKPTEEIRELAAFYSLGALTQHEARSFEAHLREGCPVCEAEYYKFKHVTAEIGLAANEIAVPDYLRELILARIERAPNLPAADLAGEDFPPKNLPGAGESAAAAADKKESAPQASQAPAAKPVLSQPVRARPSIFPWILAVLFAAAAIGAYYIYQLEKTAGVRLKEEITQKDKEIVELKVLQKMRLSDRGDLEEIISTVSKPETIILHLSGYSPAPSTSGAIIWNAQDNKCLIFGYMPPPPPGTTYQLWYFTSNEKISAGFLKPDPSGRFYNKFSIPPNIEKLTMIITREPEGGSKTPSTPYYAIGRND